MNNKCFENFAKNFIDHDSTVAIIQKYNALKFHSSLSEYKPTPLLQLTHLSEKYNVGNIYLKDESHRFGLNSFKALGASYAIHKTLVRKPFITTFCTATDGNHGRAVAWSAKMFDKKSVVFAPKDTTANRIEAIEKEGAQVIQINGKYDEACKQAEKWLKRTTGL